MATLLFVFLLYNNRYVESYSLNGFTLKSSVPMPVHGESWGRYYDDTNRVIWLLNPTQCSSSDCSLNNVVITYDIINGSFQTQSPTPLVPYGPIIRFGASNWAISMDDIIYFNGIPRNLASYDITNGVWEYIFQDTTQHEFACLVSSHNRFLYMIGGSCCDADTSSGNAAKNGLRVYDLQKNTWTIALGANLLNHRRSQATCQIYNGIIYIIGGRYGVIWDSIETLNVGMDEMNIMTNVESNTIEWIKMTETLNTARYSASSVICEQIDTDLIYIIGGRTDAEWLKTIELLNLNDNSITLLPFTLNELRSAPAVICIDEYIYVMGGTTNGDSVNSWEISNALYTGQPTYDPTSLPTSLPTINPTLDPTDDPTNDPIADPTFLPTKVPTRLPSLITSTLSSVNHNQYTTGKEKEDPPDNSQDKNGDTFLYVIIGLIMGCVFTVLLIILILIYWCKACRSQPKPPDPSPMVSVNSVSRLPDVENNNIDEMNNHKGASSEPVTASPQAEDMEMKGTQDMKEQDEVADNMNMNMNTEQFIEEGLQHNDDMDIIENVTIGNEVLRQETQSCKDNDTALILGDNSTIGADINNPNIADDEFIVE